MTAHQVEKGLDTWTLNHPKDEEAKAIEGPDENKAKASPEETKEKRKKKTA